jgi:hypothetical protein
MNLPVGSYPVTVVDYWGDFTASTICQLISRKLICFSLLSEASPPWSCTIEESGILNSKSYYEILFDDCLTPIGFVWWNNISNRWEFTDILGDNTSDFYGYNENPGLLPLSDMEYPWIEVFSQLVMTTSTLGECPPTTDICFILSSEFYGYWTCTIGISGFWNGKPYYTMLDTDCITPLEPNDTGAFVWWNNTSNQWEFTDELGVNTGEFWAYLQNPGLFPLTDIYDWVETDAYIVIVSSTLGNCCICVRIEYVDASTYGGTYLDCDGITQNWIIPEAGDSYTYLCTSNPDSITWIVAPPDSITVNGECVNNECSIPPTPSNICFLGDGEAAGGPFSCTVAPETGLINGRPYYKAVLSDCLTQFEVNSPVYIWFSTSGDFNGFWVVSELNNATFGNVFSYIEFNSNFHPIGDWVVLEPNYFISNSTLGDC